MPTVNRYGMLMCWTDGLGAAAELRCKSRDGGARGRGRGSLFSRRAAPLRCSNQLGIGRHRNTITVCSNDVTRGHRDVTASSSSGPQQKRITQLGQVLDYAHDCRELRLRLQSSLKSSRLSRFFGLRTLFYKTSAVVSASACLDAA